MTDQSLSATASSVGLLSIAINTEDLERTVAWWEEMFGAEVLTRTTFEVGDANARVAIVQGPGFRLELLEVPGSFRVPEMFVDPPRHLLPIGAKALVLQADDVEALTDELVAKGVTLVWRGAVLGGEGPVTAIRDGEGNLMTIFPRGAQSGDLA